MLADSSPVTVPLRLHPLTYLADGDSVVVGRTDIDSYGVFPPDGAELLRRLAAGDRPDEAARWYEQRYGHPVDLPEFVETLGELEFLDVDEPGESGGPNGPGESGGPGEPSRPGESGGPGAPDGSGRPGRPGGERDAATARWQRLGRWAFAPAAWLCYLTVFAAAGLAMTVHPTLVPHLDNLFFTRYAVVIELTLFFGQLPLILLHEAFHALAGRRLGLRPRLRLGWRLYFLVFETSLDGLVVVPRAKRFLPILAGMLADLLIIAVLTLVAAATITPDGTVPLLGGVCLALAFGTLLRFGWQFYFYLRTDLYCLVVTVLGCHDLQTAAKVVLRNRLRGLCGRDRLDVSGLHPRDLAVARWYSWLLVTGYTFSLGMLVWVAAPAAVRMFSMTLGRFGTGAYSWHEIADSAVFVVLNLVQLAIVCHLALRSWRGRRSASTTRPARPA